MEISADDTAEFAIVVAPGFEDVAAAEFRQWWPRAATLFGLPNSLPKIGQSDPGILTIEAPLLVGVTLNYALKIPTRILLRISSFRCRDFPKLFNKTRKLPWGRFLTGPNIEFDVTATRSRLAVEKRIHETCADAIRSWQKSALGPIHDESSQKQTIYVRLADDVCTISIDTSGGFLFKRGVRTKIEGAPLRETLAAGLLASLLFDHDLNSGPARPGLWDPMTGSGCFPLEALGLFYWQPWMEFPFRHWPIITELLHREGLSGIKELAGKMNADRPPSAFSSIVATDIAEKALASTRENLANFVAIHGDLVDLVDVRLFVGDLFGLNHDQIHPAATWCICNPPYNERLTINSDPRSFYSRMLTKISEVPSVTVIGTIAPVSFARQIATPPGFNQYKIRQFKNGGIPVQFLVYRRN